MTDHLFRFGVVAGSAPDWPGLARRVEALGYGSLLVPDTRFTLSPFAALASAAAVTTRLRLGTYVLSVANFTPGQVVREASTLDRLSGDRFELGLGAGRPGAEEDAAAFGVVFGSPGERVARVVASVEAVRAARSRPAPILVAASRPRMFEVAAAYADVVALGLPPGASEAELTAAVGRLRAVAGDRCDRLELHLNLSAVAAEVSELPDALDRMVGGDAKALAAAGGVAFLVGDRRRMVDTLRRRRDELGISYVAVNGMFADRFADVVAELSGT